MYKEIKLDLIKVDDTEKLTQKVQIINKSN